MRRLLIPLAVTIFLVLTTGIVFGLATIRIKPSNPLMLASPATFTISVTEHDVNDPNILLVMSEACWIGLTGDVEVEWVGLGSPISFAPGALGDFDTPGDKKIIADYTVASLKDHLGVPSSEDIYYASSPFLSGPITETDQTFNVTLLSSDPRMLVYAWGTDAKDNRVPPTIPGFVVPELGPMLLVTTSFLAFALLSARRKKITL